MSSEFKIQFSGRTYEFEIEDSLIFVGGNHYYKREIYKVLKRYFRYGSYSSLELEFFGTDGITVHYEGKKLTSKSNDFITIENLYDITNQFEYKKGTLLFNKINSLKENFDISHSLFKVNDALIELEGILNNNITLDNETINLNFDEFVLEDIFKNVLNITHLSNNAEVPTYFLKLENTLKIFIQLIEHRILTTSNSIWLIVNNPESFFKNTAFLDFYSELKRIAEETARLKILTFHFGSVPEYSETLLESTVLAINTLEQLPSADTLYKSIARNYPCKLSRSRKNIFDSFYRVSNFIGDNQLVNYYLVKKDMVLLYVLKDMVGDDSHFDVLDDDLTDLEEEYLKTKEKLKGKS